MLVNPSIGIRGVPVTVTASLNTTVTLIVSPATYVPSAPALDVNDSDDTDGTVNVNPELCATAPPEPVSVTMTAPAAWAGVTTVTDVAPTLLIDVPAAPPKSTEEVPVKLVPVIVTVVPPAAEPLDGERGGVIVGAAT